MPVGVLILTVSCLTSIRRQCSHLGGAVIFEMAAILDMDLREARVSSSFVSS